MHWLAAVTRGVGGTTAAMFAIAVLMGLGANLYADNPGLCEPSGPECVSESAAYFSTFSTITMTLAMVTTLFIVANTIHTIRSKP